MEDNYWRELTLNLLGWGIATCFVVIGWTINSGDLFYFHATEEIVVYRTWFTNIVVLMIGFAWVAALYFVSSQIPRGQPHLNKFPILLVAIVFLLLTSLILIMTSIYNPPEKKCNTDLSYMQICCLTPL